MKRLSLLLILPVFLAGVPAIDAGSEPRDKSGSASLASGLQIGAPVAPAANRMQRELPESIANLKLDSPVTVTAANPVLDRSLVGAVGSREVIVRLKDESVARGNTKFNLQRGQSEFLARCQHTAPSARLIAQTHMVLNAVFLRVDAKELAVLATDPAIYSIKAVSNYEMDLSETVPYIGASAVQDLGFDGDGVKVAVLDSGVDYTHVAFGGDGTIAAYEAAYGTDPTDPLNTTRDGLFPTARVVDGFDFVGELWVGGGGPPLAPDDDPIPSPDATTFGGHGTHVADITGGEDGVAPGVDLYAVKVCASLSNACSGVALIQGMDFAVDPNGDGDPEDAVDIINMSLGSGYGDSFNDDLSFAVDNATAFGVLTVSSAGNGADKPYVQGTPSGARTALSVAQTQVPSAGLQLIDVESLPQIPGVFQSWSAPLVSTIAADVVFGGDFGSALGCSTGADPNSTDPNDAPYAPGTFAGEIVLVDRGACNFSIKIFNIQQGGGGAGIIGLVAPGAPFDGAFGAGGPYTIPGYMIDQADSQAVQGLALPVPGSIDPANVLPQVMSMVSSSARGPNTHNNVIKPEIGAPGASVSADSGSGDATSGFGGTSGASPMVAGSAALLMDARRYQGLMPFEIKALLMNTAETSIINDVLIGDDAPITRIGGGEVRVDRAFRSAAAAWDDEDPSSGGGLSFGFHDVSKNTMVLHKKVRVRNYSGERIEFEITPTFRSPGPEASGAVEIDVVSSIMVPARQDRTFTVKMTVHGDLLPGNFMNSGSVGNLGAMLTENEFDGYLFLDPISNGSPKGTPQIAGGVETMSVEPIHVAWHVLPRQAARVVPSRNKLMGGGFPEIIGLNNTGVGTAQNDAYSLIAWGPNLPSGDVGEQSPVPDIAAVGINTIPVPAGFCSGEDSFLWLFAINSHERQRHLIQPVSYQITLDTNQDGVDDYVVLNRDLSFNGISDGRQLAWTFDLNTGGANAFFFAEHAMNTGDTVLVLCGEQIGLTGTDLLATNVDITSIFAQDFYYGGPGAEVVAPGMLTVTPLGEQYFGLVSDVPGKTNDPGALEVFDFGPFPGNTQELGLLLITNGDRGGGARGGATEDTEAILLPARSLP